MRQPIHGGIQALVFNTSAAKAPRIPSQLAIALLNEPVKPVRCTIPVFEESMSPTLLVRSPLVIEQLQDPTDIEGGQIYYIVDNNLKGFLRRVTAHEGSDYLRLSCDNPDKDRWPAHYMRAQAVRAIFKVVH